MKKYEDIWENVYAQLKVLYSENIFQEVFADINKIYKYQNGYIYMLVQNEFTKTRLNKLYLNKINTLIENYSNNETIKIKFITKEEIIETSSFTKPDERINEVWRNGNLNSNYSFNNFVLGNSNRLAYTVALQTAENPGVAANPLYIFGDVGLGKTHLMQAIGNYILDQDINKIIMYIKADTFMEEYISAVKKERLDANDNTFQQFYDRYRKVDVLLVDDIQSLGTARKSQQEFFKLFDILVYQQNKQVVITSDRPASELNDFMDRLRSRFQAGVLVDIKIPDLDHRVAILKRKLHGETSNPDIISDDVLEFIASCFVTNIRELEGALKRVLFFCVTNNIDITIDSAKEALAALLNGKKFSNALNENNYDRLLSIVSSYYNISLSDMIGNKRHLKYSLPRHISMYLLRKKYNIPYKKIGMLYNGRDHSTVLAACEKIENEINTTQELKNVVDIIIQKIDKT